MVGGRELWRRLKEWEHDLVIWVVIMRNAALYIQVRDMRRCWGWAFRGGTGVISKASVGTGHFGSKESTVEV